MVVQLSGSQCFEKRRVVFELASNGTPQHHRFRVVLGEFRNQNVKRMINSAAFVMDDVIIASYGCPDQTLPWKRRVRDRISRVPMLARFGKLAFVVDTKGNNRGWQVLGGMNFVEARSIEQHFAIFRRKRCTI